MQYDDMVRRRFGVTVCLRDMGNGKSRLFFDDVIADKETNPIKWGFSSFYTFTPQLESAELEDMKLSDERFKEIGENLVLRLLALNGRPE